MKKIIYLAGWAHPAISMQPLADEVSRLLPDTTYELFSIDQLSTDDLVAEGASCLAELISEKNGDIVVGWSLGGMISLEAASRKECQMEKVVLISTTFSFVESEEAPFAVSAKSIKALKALLASDTASTLNDFYQRCLSPEADDGFLSKVLSRTSCIKPEKLLIGLNYLEQKNLYLSAIRLKIPSLVIHGTSDSIITVDAARAFSNIAPQSELMELQGGHYIVLTQVKRIAKRIAEFVGS